MQLLIQCMEIVLGKSARRRKAYKRFPFTFPPKLEFFFLCQKVLEIEIAQQPKQKRYPRSYPKYLFTTYVSKLSRGALTSVAFPTARTTNFNTDTGSQIYSIEINSSAHETRLPTSGRKGRRVSWADEFISLKILASGSISMKEISPSMKLVCPPHHLEIRVRKQENRFVGVAR